MPAKKGHRLPTFVASLIVIVGAYAFLTTTGTPPRHSSRSAASLDAATIRYHQPTAPVAIAAPSGATDTTTPTPRP